MQAQINSNFACITNKFILENSRSRLFHLHKFLHGPMFYFEIRRYGRGLDLAFNIEFFMHSSGQYSCGC